MKLCKKTVYYVAAVGGKYMFGKATPDMLAARVTLDRARRTYPREVWNIIALTA